MNNVEITKHKTTELLAEWKQEFCEIFVKTRNATEAYHRVKPLETRAHEQKASHNLMQQKIIKSYIEELDKQYQELSEITKENMLKMISEMMMVAKSNGKTKEFIELSKEYSTLTGFRNHVIQTENITILKESQLSDDEQDLFFGSMGGKS